LTGLIDNICTAPSEPGGVGIPPPRRRGASENGPQKRAKPLHSHMKHLRTSAARSRLSRP